MPTKRTWGFLILAVALYFLANQTQVGWVYIITDGIIGLLIVAFLYSLGGLTPLRATRVLRNLSAIRSSPAPSSQSKRERGANGDEVDNLDVALPSFHEDDAIQVTLQFHNPSFRPAFLVSGDEFCPFAPANDQSQPWFIPSLFKNQPVNLSYQTTCDRRGLYTFPQLRLFSKGPFGLFSTKRMLSVPDEILIYPYYHPLKRLRLLETRELAERQTTRVGVGSQVVSTREYRPGDSLRQIHWRSTAHLGKLVVKEFAEEDQPTLTVVLDLEATSSIGRGKFSTFETAVRLAATFGYYTTKRNIPFYLVGASPKWTPPATPLGWWAILNYLAKVRNDGQEPLAKVLNELPPLPFLVVLISNPNVAITRALTILQQKGTQTLAIFITPDGTIPKQVHISKAIGLEIKSVSPHNWADMLEDW
jgi:uncharacterized protein (DUF58 family)